MSKFYEKRMIYNHPFYCVQIKRKIFWIFSYWETIAESANLIEMELLYKIAHKIKHVDK